MKIAIAGATGLIGSQLNALARAEGHDVVEIARETGFDLLRPDGLEAALDGVDTVVDVTAEPHARRGRGDIVLQHGRRKPRPCGNRRRRAAAPSCSR